jgi:hypothetical protein
LGPLTDMGISWWPAILGDRREATISSYVERLVNGRADPRAAQAG